MVIAAALVENQLKSLISEHFGRCEWYGIYNTESRKILYVENPGRQLNRQAGLLSAALLLEHNVSMVIAGRFGAKVVNAFKTNHVQMIIPQNKKAWNDFIKIVNKIK